MKVICKNNSAKDLDLKGITGFFNKDAKYSLVIGREYLVMGIMITRNSNCLYYLVDNDAAPSWNPYFFFHISDNSLPNNWYVDVSDHKSSHGLFYLSGFYELCNDEEYHDLLMECDRNARLIYFTRKNEFKNNQ